jgi:hypothetical protein
MSKTTEFLKNADKGFYLDARTKGITPLQYMAEQVEPEPPEVEKVYQRKLKQLKQADDGSYRASAIYDHAEQAAALGKCLTERKIQGRDRIEKAFFESVNDSNLFPAFLANSIIAGQLAGSLVPFFVAMDERVDQQVVEKITMNETASQRRASLSGEGSELAELVLARAEGSVQLYKYGFQLKWSYETARRMRVNQVALHLQRAGIQMGIDQTDDMIEVLLAGDGTSGSTVVDTDAEVSGTLDYDELVRLLQAFPIGYQMDRAIINDVNTRTILNMSQFMDPLVRVKFQDRGLDPAGMDILGARFHRWTSTGSTTFSTDRILAVDSRFAAARLQEGDMLEESDRIIERQLNRTTMSVWEGWMKLENSATQVLDITA